MNSSDIIREKREYLISFVKEQMVGPNALHGKYGIDDWDKGEVIDETPGSIYSTGILFPKKDSSKLSATEENETPAEDAATSVPEDVGNTSAGQQDSNDESNVSGAEDSEDESKELCQRFPQSYGLSFCLSKKILSDKDLKITIKGRYYTKVFDNSNLYVVINAADLDSVSDILSNTELKSYYRNKDGKLYLSSSIKKDYATIKNLLNQINKSLSKKAMIGDLSLRDGVELYLASYKEHLYEKRIQNTNVDDANRQDAKKRLTFVEKCERTLSYFEELLSFLNSEAYGFWKAEDFVQTLDLSDISLDLGNKNRLTYSPNDNPSLQNVIQYSFASIGRKKEDSGTASISAWLQIVKDNRRPENQNIYVKVLLQNTSCKMKEKPGNLYSIVNESVNVRSFFGVEIDVQSKYIVKYQSLFDSNLEDKELSQLNYTYRNTTAYGVGHTCSVSWKKDENSIFHVHTDFIPSYEVPDVDVLPQKVLENANGSKELIPWICNSKFLEFKTLSTLSNETNEDIINGLNAFADAYNDWIDSQDTDNNEIAEEILSKCKSDYSRIKRNINLLHSPLTMKAFRLMNTSMFLQLWHSREENLKFLSDSFAGRRRATVTDTFYRNLSGEVVKGKGNAAWRSFQLAFILLNLDGIVQDEENDPDWHFRNGVVDLVWFPTGGGKTEAYLGLISLCIIVKRFNANINNSYEGGTTAIMRYTLRLLATQQFQRAMRLILALDTIRRWPGSNLGTEPISIGLYVGDSSLPNSLSGDNGLRHEATELWAKDLSSRIPLDHHHCPWCGGELSYESNMFCCSNSHCTFKLGLPVLLCDDLVYQTPPTLLFGTVDKFAMIAHKISDNTDKDSRRLLNLKGSTPDLIIQDELHLLSGPLGSAVGLFECAIDLLSTRTKKLSNGKTLSIRPKVISSTATTRNTEHQINALYGRSVNVFPKSGVNYYDSFYSSYKRNKTNPDSFVSKRKYVGILPTGRTGMYTQLRLASCILAHRALYENDHLYGEDQTNRELYLTAIDYYHTLICYFNSKKDVGTTDTQFATEFPKYTRQIFQRVLRPNHMLNPHYTYNDAFTSAELTGRLKGDEVITALQNVQRKWDIDKRDTHIDDSGHLVKGITPPDVVLATNMISVGIDVSRFSTMIVNSMPRNKAEYIQATSRVARDECGVVFTIHNPFRARDVSHFEQFVEFHEKLYYYVEPISITPFSKRTIEAFMPLYLGAVIRHSIDDLSLDANVRNIDDDKAKKIFQMVHEYFERLANDKRFKDVIDIEALNFIDSFVEKALKEWCDKKDSLRRYSSLRYDIQALYIPTDAYEEERLNNSWIVPKSVRFVPTESVIKIKQ